MTRHKGSEFTQIESERLMLRRFLDSDLGPVLAYRTDPNVGRYQDWGDYARADAERLLDGVDLMNPNVPGEWF